MLPEHEEGPQRIVVRPAKPHPFLPPKPGAANLAQAQEECWNRRLCALICDVAEPRKSSEKK